ncbi:MAG: single-stranded-DNA-specific exonuclease RecJ [Chitinophagia bacterium]|nr:single-stranded-DNA-specific exonuclease RecJ [Chitinophagia bacterium]
MKLDKRWTLKPYNTAIAQHLQDSLKVSPLIAKLLAQRGIDSYEGAQAFFDPQLSHLHNPYLMAGMDASVARIMQAITAGEPIMVYGDYDVDGTTAVAIVYDYLHKQYKGNITYYLPHRYREGYGISKIGIDYAIEHGLIGYARENGIDIIVCDHHLPDKQLPPAYAILNPKQPNCPYPYKELSGCGIGFKLITAIAMHLNQPVETVYRYLDLVATSIAADIVPIDGENRVLAYYGIKKINENPSPAIAILKQLAGANKTLSVSDLVFVIGPRVNAAGRMDDARKAVELFIETDPEKITHLAQTLQETNDDRKEVDKTTYEEALELLNTDPHLAQKKSTVLYKEHWHKGVVGIVASRLIDHYYRPTIILTGSNGKATGSARSVAGFNIYEAIYACRHLLESYGGHFFAAGLTIDTANIPAFIEQFERIVAETISPEQELPEVLIDAEIPISAINMANYKQLKKFEPFGPGNMKPVFMSKHLLDHQAKSKVVKDIHLRIVAEQLQGSITEGIGFGLGYKYDSCVANNQLFDMTYTIEENEFNGNTRLQVRAIDLRVSEF